MNEERKLNDVDDFFDDDVPLADADIRRGYEAALGACMLAFNQLDHLPGKILRTTLDRLGREDLVREWVDTADFNQRVRLLDLLKHSAEGARIGDISVADLRSVAGERDVLAHAHFEQNPFDGEYWLVNRKGETVQRYSAARIDGVASRTAQVWMALRHVEACYVFNKISLAP